MPFEQESRGPAAGWSRQTKFGRFPAQVDRALPESLYITCKGDSKAVF